jgi:hypothetical protein
VSSIKSWASIEKKDGENGGRGDGETIKNDGENGR